MTAFHKETFLLTPPHGRTFSSDIRFQTGKPPQPLVIFVHGFKGFKDWGYWNLLADHFATHGFAFLKLNLSHNGATPTSEDLEDMEAFGRNNFTIELADLESLLNFLFSEENPFREALDLDKIAIIGHSRGGGLVLLKAAEDSRIKAVATWASVSNLNPGWNEDVIAKWKANGVIFNMNTRTLVEMPLYYQLYEDFVANAKRFDVENAAANLQQPLLIVHGDADPVVPVAQARRLHELQPASQLEIIAGADHSFGGSHPYTKPELPELAKEAAEKTVAFFKQKL